MERITIDAGLPDRIKALTGPAELVDADGRVLAVVQPRLDPGLYEIIGADVADEELERRCGPDRKTYTAGEVLTMLRKLP